MDPPRETRRQREARERREAKQARKAEIDRLKREERERKENRKRNIQIAMDNFNRRNNVNTKYISRVRSYFKRRGRDLTTAEVEQILLNDYLYIPRDGGEVEMPVKLRNIGYVRTRVQLWFIDKDVLFTDENLNEMYELLDKLYENVPNGFIFGCAILGKYYGRASVRDETVFKSNLTDDIEEVKLELRNSGRLNEASERYYLAKHFQIFYEMDQGGKRIDIDFSDLKDYSIFNPDSNDSCGMQVLKKYNIKSRRGFMTVADVKSYNPPVPVFSEAPKGNKITEFILLRDNHFVICTHKNKKKEIRKDNKIKLHTSTEWKLKQKLQAQGVNNKFKKLVFDIESKNQKIDKKTYQIPVLMGMCEKIESEYIYTYYEGDDCIEKFVNKIKTEHYTHIIGFNSGKYDYILIRNELIKQGADIKEYRKSANSLMKAIISFGQYKTELIDLCNFTLGSLRNNLKTYKCKVSKGEIDYDLIGVDTSKEFNDKLIDYCKSDVIGTYQLYEKLEEPYTERGIIFLDLFTASQGAYKICKNKWSLSKCKVTDRITRKVDDFFRKSIYGGRVEVFKREFKSSLYEKILKGEINYNEVDDYMRALDVNSLYPSAMRNNLYPVGKEIATSKFINDKLGIYNCKIKKVKNLVYPVCCNKQNGYNLDDDEGVYTSVDILQMRKYGYDVKVLGGYYWGQSDYIFKEYIDEFYEIKKNSTKGSPQYENAKLMLNAIYGKMIQRDEYETNFTFSTYEEFEACKLKGMNDKNGKWSGYIDVDTGVMNMTFTQHQKDFTSKKSYLGSFILSYSKVGMYDMFDKSDPYYTDTDSVYVENSKSDLFDIGEELGQFSDDYKGKIIYACFTAKKLKYIELLQPDYIYVLDEDGKFKLDEFEKKIIAKDKNGELLYNNNNKYTIKRIMTGKGCFVDTLTKKDFKQMLKGLEVVNVRPFKMVRNLKDGTVEYVKDDQKIVKMNDSNRVFNGNNSKPLGYLIN
jgi:hypothetical protein